MEQDLAFTINFLPHYSNLDGPKVGMQRKHHELTTTLKRRHPVFVSLLIGNQHNVLTYILCQQRAHEIIDEQTQQPEFQYMKRQVLSTKRSFTFVRSCRWRPKYTRNFSQWHLACLVSFALCKHFDFWLFMKKKRTNHMYKLFIDYLPTGMQVTNSTRAHARTWTNTLWFKQACMMPSFTYKTMKMLYNTALTI